MSDTIRISEKVEDNKINLTSKHIKIRNILEEGMKHSDNRTLTEEFANQILSEYGIKVPEFALVKNVMDASKKASEIGFPLVAKVVSTEVLHKTDINGIKFPLNSEEEVKVPSERNHFRKNGSTWY
jgi:acyl-CoA synthetase (NDP forming)